MDGVYYLLGDNAYPISEHLITPFSGCDGPITQARDSFNFYLSQLRIRIEMAFGFLVGKWRIFRRPLQVKLENPHKIIVGAMCLHNFCMNGVLSASHATTAGETGLDRDSFVLPISRCIISS
eukprot:TRINITY_DN6652_c0_g1_i7.p1 TRINITY_DN6652_c0_g1~~TRINITY_DN6652_c0_g1_i7.p1  ORF type:complete len:122 (-),score=16.64 TRINITY_DN6652_c0_g1_i7:172-537(-)